ncbi:unnamed protein product [Cladocopium goreaui]|uniref:B-related factor 1 n=1 Tax=Cladocopium goreaui TaxID=2562237 RepID=A0A9P1GM37_9DINO|nr:unnamed protein product [Cladocopium goreaui]
MDPCRFCGSFDLVHNDARGDTVCGNCGELLEDRTMVTEATFITNSKGAKALAGATVDFTTGLFQGPSSHEVALTRGLSKIGHLADRLQLPAQIQEAGRRMYQLAVQLNFNAGLQQRYVTAACLYVVCRRNRSPQMLIDFSDVLQTPVKTIGRVYMKLMRRLVGGDAAHQQLGNTAVEVPLVDPSIFIERFARRLTLGGMQRKVQNTAMRLIQFMHRDWICIGRRPNGLCGAALLIASFYHGFRCSPKEIAEVVRMSEATLLTRLRELKDTPMARLSRDEFDKEKPELLLGEEHQTLPPCLKLSRAMKQAALEGPDQAALEGPSEVSALRALQDGADPAKSTRQADTDMPPPPVPVKRKRDEDEQMKKAERYTTRRPTEDDVQSIAKDIASHHGIEPILEGVEDPDTQARLKRLTEGKPDFAEDAVTDGAEKAAGCKAGDGEKDQEDGGESLSDVDDEELEGYLLDAEEKQNKSDIWHEVNKDYLEEWHLRSLEQKRKKMREHVNAEQKANQAGPAGSEGYPSHQDSASETNGSSRRAPASSRRRKTSVSSCTQSALMGLAKKGKVAGNRINLEALESLFS